MAEFTLCGRASILSVDASDIGKLYASCFPAETVPSRCTFVPVDYNLPEPGIKLLRRHVAPISPEKNLLNALNGDPTKVIHFPVKLKVPKRENNFLQEIFNSRVFKRCSCV